MIYHQKTGILYHVDLLETHKIEFYLEIIFFSIKKIESKNKSLKFAKLITQKKVKKNACRHILYVFQQRKKMQILLDGVQK